MEFSNQLSHAYFFAKNMVIDHGYAHEIDWQDSLVFDELNENKFMSEISWVILASGMNDRIVRKIHPQIKKIMCDFQSVKSICSNKDVISKNATAIFNHKGKINAILFIAEFINVNSFEFLKSRILEGGISFIQTLPYMGKATSYHLAKNIGLDFAKPDRHLLRVADILGFNSPSELCSSISNHIQEKASVIDLVIWRYCTLDRDYTSTLKNYVIGSYCKIQENLC